MSTMGLLSENFDSAINGSSTKMRFPKIWVASCFLIMFACVVLLSAYLPVKTIPLAFTCLSVSIYVLFIPRYLLVPENIVFGYYFVWYGIAPLFATRFDPIMLLDDIAIKAYLLLATTYVFLMGAFYYAKNLKYQAKIKGLFKGRGQPHPILYLAIFSLVGLLIYFQKSGGFVTWYRDPGLAYISRSGAGPAYLMFLHSLFLISAIWGAKSFRIKSVFLPLTFMVLILLLYPFVGSKLMVFLCAFLSVFPYFLKTKLFERRTISIFILGFILLALGLYQRNSSWMKLGDFLPYFFNYFNTFEMFYLFLRDYGFALGETIFMPINKVLMKSSLGYIDKPFFDISMWLTSIYYPHASRVGGTEQWPIESEMILNFWYFGEFVLILLYSIVLDFLRRLSFMRNMAFSIIYIFELFFLLSKLRGGLFSWWYLYLIPFYLVIYFLFSGMTIEPKQIQA